MVNEGEARLTSLREIVSSQRSLVVSTEIPTHVVTYLQRAVPSFSASSTSPAAKGSPKTPSIHVRTSFAAVAVYLDKRIFRMSLSRDETEAMVVGGSLRC